MRPDPIRDLLPSVPFVLSVRTTLTGNEGETDLKLDEMDLDALQKHKEEVEAAIERAHKRQRDEAVAELKKISDKTGFSLAELMDAAGVKKTSKKSSFKANHPPTHRNPDDHEQTWHGKGRYPQWMVKKIEQGFKKDDFLIQQ
jgi:DNA-binding protein H-NS